MPNNPSLIVCSYLQPFKSYKALKLAIAEKTPQNSNIFGSTGGALGAYGTDPYIIGTLSPRPTIASQIVRSYLPPFKSYKALNLAIGEKTQNFNIFGHTGGALAAFVPDLYVVAKLSPRPTTILQVVCSYLPPFKSYKALNLAVAEKNAKFQHFSL